MKTKDYIQGLLKAKTDEYNRQCNSGEETKSTELMVEMLEDILRD